MYETIPGYLSSASDVHRLLADRPLGEYVVYDAPPSTYGWRCFCVSYVSQRVTGGRVVMTTRVVAVHPATLAACGVDGALMRKLQTMLADGEITTPVN